MEFHTFFRRIRILFPQFLRLGKRFSLYGIRCQSDDLSDPAILLRIVFMHFAQYREDCIFVLPLLFSSAACDLIRFLL